MTSFRCGDAAIIPDEDMLWRRFIDDPNHLTWEGDRPFPHPVSSEQMHMERGEHGLSTSWREHLLHHELGPEAVLEGRPKFTLVGEIVVGDTRIIGMNVYHDPTGDLPINCAHTAVDWPTDLIPAGSDRPPSPERKRIKNDLARLFTFIYGVVTSERPPDN
jgi:hypothetical protein